MAAAARQNEHSAAPLAPSACSPACWPVYRTWPALRPTQRCRASPLWQRSR